MLALLALIFTAISLGLSLALAARLRALGERLALVERSSERVPLEGRKGEPWGRGLAGVRIALSIRQDHPHPIFANLLREALLKEGASIEDADPDLRIEGEIVGNGYADVYFRAELTAWIGDETIVALSEKPPHGDRPANLATEVVQRLKYEMDKRERRLAVRELHQRG